ncbi:Integral membrane protein [Fructilactobacillus florum 8D]|uniref:Integral membrane protein n=1 Tax=Fructilactobacillus florum 8D TaxID=1221538 RepID=W9EHV0_9LACO|nr:threonine/serine exporter family protein [Fructilactobacillus florum]EKK20563.1 Integral membrane protein [Fructilactobacillus florum 2F]ETO40831.1 Integral membrane protein [Fructilactobacillus florum 8D]
MYFILVLIEVYIATVGFAVLINVSPRALNLSGLVGTAGYVSYLGYQALISDNYVAENLVGAFTIGIVGMLAARYKKMPVIVFNIPALVPLVPGGQAYQVMKYIALRQPHVAFSYVMQVVMIAGALAMGFLLAELFIQAGDVVHRLFSTWRATNYRRK